MTEGLNFLLTNRIPRLALTRFMGWFSKLEQPFVRDLSLAAWQLFADLRLDEARKAQFSSMHDCFVRELKPGARPVDPDPAVLTSPCDAIVGASGTLDGRSASSGQGFFIQLCRTSGSMRVSSACTETAPTSRCASPRACTTASTRRTTCA